MKIQEVGLGNHWKLIPGESVIEWHSGRVVERIAIRPEVLMVAWNFIRFYVCLPIALKTEFFLREGLHTA